LTKDIETGIILNHFLESQLATFCKQNAPSSSLKGDELPADGHRRGKGGKMDKKRGGHDGLIHSVLNEVLEPFGSIDYFDTHHCSLIF